MRRLNAKTGALLAAIGSSQGDLGSPGAELGCEMCSLARCGVVCCLWACLDAVKLCMAFNFPGTGGHSTTHRALTLCNQQDVNDEFQALTNWILRTSLWFMWLSPSGNCLPPGPWYWDSPSGQPARLGLRAHIPKRQRGTRSTSASFFGPVPYAGCHAPRARPVWSC